MLGQKICCAMKGFNSHLAMSFFFNFQMVLQVYYMKKMAGYKDRMKKTAFTLGEDLIEEIYDKSSMIRQMIEEEVGNRNMRIVEEAFMPVKYHIVANVNRLIQMIQTTANSSW